MKRKKTNITTTSLCSVSSKRSKRAISTTNTNSHLQSPNASNPYSSTLGRPNNADIRTEKTTVGSESKKAHFCHGCNKKFRLEW